MNSSFEAQVRLVPPTASELLGLERRDIEVKAGVLHVRRAQTARSQRSVPMPLRARQALAGLPDRVDTRIVFPAPAKKGATT